MQDGKANILGAEYSIFFVKEFPERLKKYEDDSDGLCERFEKEIYVLIPSDEDLTEKASKQRMKQILRHELIHSFLDESGISANANAYDGAWCENEEMVDWFAIQAPKIFKLFKELDAL